MLKVHSLESFGTHEGPGIRFVIFLQGCNYRCLYCHNPDTQDLAGGKETADEELLKQIASSKPYFKDNGGVTFSGGEPLLQARELTGLCRKIKEKGFNIALDTNGNFLNDDVKELLNYVDLVLLDIKHIDADWHKKITGQEISGPLSFAAYLKEINKPVWLRYVLVPGYTDQPKYLKQLGEHFKDYSNIQRLEILPYHTFGVHKFKELGRDYALKDVPVPDNQQVQNAKELLTPFFQQVYIR